MKNLLSVITDTEKYAKFNGKILFSKLRCANDRYITSNFTKCPWANLTLSSVYGIHSHKTLT